MTRCLRLALVLVAAATVAVGSGEAATRWYWGTKTAATTIQRFLFACGPGNECTAAERRNSRNLGLVGADASGRGGEIVMAARCSGVEPHVHSTAQPRVPLFHEHACRITLWTAWPKEHERRIWLRLVVLGRVPAKPGDRLNFAAYRLPPAE